MRGTGDRTKELEAKDGGVSTLFREERQRGGGVRNTEANEASKSV
jgi:hypothetical protein